MVQSFPIIVPSDYIAPQDVDDELLDDDHFGHPTDDIDPKQQQEVDKAAAVKAASGKSKLRASICICYHMFANMCFHVQWSYTCFQMVHLSKVDFSNAAAQ